MAEDMRMATVEFEEARALADAVGILQDLEFVIAALNRLEGVLAAGEEDGVGMRAYWSSALIAYARCFGSGVRDQLREDVFEGIRSPQYTALEAHRDEIAMRNKHVAHSVNAFERTLVGLVMPPESDRRREVDGVAWLSMSFNSPTIEGVHSLLDLARVAKRHIVDRIDELREQVLEVGRTLPFDDLVARTTPSLRLYGAGPEHLKTARQPSGGR